MLDDFLTRAALAGLGVALAAAPLGCVVTWRRMAYFGDATAHAAVLGVALALAVDAPVTAGALLIALSMALAMGPLSGRGWGTDTLLGVMAHGALAVGLTAVALVPGARVDLESLLFGDVLAVSHADLAVIWGGAALVAGLLAWRWGRIVTSTVDPDLARAAGIDPKLEGLIVTLALAVTVAVALKVVGALLIGAMLIIPPAAARPFTRTPERMVIGAGLVGAASVLGGLWAAWHLDTPAGPTIVSVAAGLFLLATLKRA
ncbi:MAG: metal ABC transporter permease [Paracoccaceae bacterium]